MDKFLEHNPHVSLANSVARRNCDSIFASRGTAAAIGCHMHSAMHQDRYAAASLYKAAMRSSAAMRRKLGRALCAAAAMQPSAAMRRRNATDTWPFAGRNTAMRLPHGAMHQDRYAAGNPIIGCYAAVRRYAAEARAGAVRRSCYAAVRRYAADTWPFASRGTAVRLPHGAMRAPGPLCGRGGRYAASAAMRPKRRLRPAIQSYGRYMQLPAAMRPKCGLALCAAAAIRSCPPLCGAAMRLTRRPSPIFEAPLYVAATWCYAPGQVLSRRWSN